MSVLEYGKLCPLVAASGRADVILFVKEKWL